MRRKATNPRDLGTRFEKLTKDFFIVDKNYSLRFSDVWLWSEWPQRDGADTGIDLIAEESDGGLCAIQCKCYADDGMLNMKAVSTFLAKASSLKMRNKIVVYTGENITPHADKVMRDHECTMIRSKDFDDSSVDWSQHPKLLLKRPKELRPHQVRALCDVLTEFEKHDRGRMIMACGTGKTLTALHIAEQEVGIGGMVLYAVPSISLVLQSMREWSRNANIDHRYLAVCSDKSTSDDASITELDVPASTDSEELRPQLEKRSKERMTIVFSTYHSLDVVAKAMGKRCFDMAFADEAHRTTGVEDKSFFTLIHDNKKISAKKRLYMTATPRVYSEEIKKNSGKVVYSMDDEEKFGPEFHNLSFTKAVEAGILADFKVKVAIVPEDVVDREFQHSIAHRDSEMPLDERTLLAAVWHALQYPENDTKPHLLQRVIAFANRIDRSKMFAGEISNSQDADISFQSLVNEYNKTKQINLKVEVEHLDGKSKALYRRDKMNWLNESANNPKTCRILSNAKCLSEGVDVPALDGVIFLNPRQSKTDVVQAVGRVMRRSPGKKYGYVILPVALPAGKEYHESLNDNRTFKVVWQVLNALRSHDENFAAEINKLILDRKTESTSPTPRISVSIIGKEDGDPEIITRFFDKVKSELIRKVGDINYYDSYGKQLGESASRVEAKIENMIKLDTLMKKDIEKLHDSMKIMINDWVTMKDMVQMLAHHVVLSKIFDALFQGEFKSHNPISTALDQIAKNPRFSMELARLEEFYTTAQRELKEITTMGARQNFIKKIYENFFKSAYRKGSEKHGIVYTPVEVIDFIIQSVEHILNTEFDLSFGDRSVSVLDPFTGTGTFITRLLQSGLIKDNLYEKYRRDLYANELILLAYYVASVNIETTYQSLANGKYVPFSGICYTDTLNTHPRYREEKQYRQVATKLDGTFNKAHNRIKKQNKSCLWVIMGNPPYSAGQSNYNDDNPNINYPEIDKRIKDTYAFKTKLFNPNIGRIASIYDSYIRSIRWASDRIGESGIIGFVTNAGFLRSDTGAGIRACLTEEFTDVWCFDLRGNQRTQGEISKKEGGKVFGSGSRAPVAITILVKNPSKKKHTIRYHDIGDYHSREKKLEIIRESKSINGISDWQIIKPDRHHDWLDQRNIEFYKYLPIGSKDAKKGNDDAMFWKYCGGVSTSRDAWAYNSSSKELAKNMKNHIDYCNSQDWDNPVHSPKEAKWGREILAKLKRFGKQKFHENYIRTALYRPFFKQQMYFDGIFNDWPYQIPTFFPDNDSDNLVICVPYKFTGAFSAFISNITPDLELVHHGQCFPFYVYKDGKKHDNITDRTLSDYRNHYNDSKIIKQDIFYYVYGLLHHPEYRKKYASNLSKELPRIPMAPDFWGFSKIGKKLADLHLSWDTCKRYHLGSPQNNFVKYNKMDFAKVIQNGKQVVDYTTLRINGNIVFTNIPKVKYRINGRTPLEWAIDRYKFTIDKESGITNDSTKIEIIPMIERLIYVGVESDRLISLLPKEFEPDDWEPNKTGLDAFPSE